MSENDVLEIDAYSLTNIHQHTCIHVYFIWSLMNVIYANLIRYLRQTIQRKTQYYKQYFTKQCTENKNSMNPNPI